MPDDPRRCPVCGTWGIRYDRNSRFDPVGLRRSYECPNCGARWETVQKRTGRIGRRRHYRWRSEHKNRSA